MQIFLPLDLFPSASQEMRVQVCREALPFTRISRLNSSGMEIWTAALSCLVFVFFMFPDRPCQFKSGAEIRELDIEKQDFENIFPKSWTRRIYSPEMKPKHRNASLFPNQWTEGNSELKSNWRVNPKSMEINNPDIRKSSQRTLWVIESSLRGWHNYLWV